MAVPASTRPPLRADWLGELASGYLLGFPPSRLERRPGLWGHVFEQTQGRTRSGFFVGFLTRGASRGSRWGLDSDPPECLVFAFIRPLGSRRHAQLVAAEGSPFRQAFARVTKYTARRPRFEFREQHLAAIARHIPLANFPHRQREKYARNFFTETLALLVRSGLPAALVRCG